MKSQDNALGGKFFFFKNSRLEYIAAILLKNGLHYRILQGTVLKFPKIFCQVLFLLLFIQEVVTLPKMNYLECSVCRTNF